MRSHYWVRSGRAELATEVIGSGSVVVFLHANVCDSRMWRAQLNDVGGAYKVVAYDRRGFGQTRAETEDFSAVSDLMAVIDSVTRDEPVILVGCSQGGKIAVDATLEHPSRVRGLILIAPSVGGAPEAVYSPEIRGLIDLQRDVEASGDVERITSVKARLWLDGPLAPEGRVSGHARQLFHEMNALALRSPPVGTNIDMVAAFQRLSEIQARSLVMWGSLDFPHIQKRSSRVATTMANGKGQMLAGAAHLPSMERPGEVTRAILDFVARLSSDHSA